MWEYRYEADSFGCAFATNVEDPVEFAAQIQSALHESEQPRAIYKKHMERARRNCSLESVSSKYEHIYQTMRRAA